MVVAHELSRTRTNRLTNDVNNKGVLTTGEVASICCVAARTVTNWIDIGLLEGYRIPGSKDRRVEVSHLLKFMKKNGMPFYDLYKMSRLRILFVTTQVDNFDALKACLNTEPRNRYFVELASSRFTAGLLLSKHDPHVMFIESDELTLGTEEIIPYVRDKYPMAKIVAMTRAGMPEQLSALRAKIDIDHAMSLYSNSNEFVQAIDQVTNLVD